MRAVLYVRLARLPEGKERDPVNDLIVFLRARLDEDEAAAQAAAGAALDAHWTPESIAEDERTHIVRYGPARVLREVQAKRTIVRRCETCMDELDIYLNGLVSPRAFLARQTLADLGAVYGDHPDYREEWKR